MIIFSIFLFAQVASVSYPIVSNFHVVVIFTRWDVVFVLGRYVVLRDGITVKTAAIIATATMPKTLLGSFGRGYIPFAFVTDESVVSKT